MGQRHQVYIFHHTQNSKSGRPDCTAFHNQWCYGSLPLRHVKAIAHFHKRADKYTRLSTDTNYNDIPEMLRSIMAVGDVFDGSYARYTDITSEVSTGTGGIDPGLGDNNDGITILYVPQEKTTGRGPVKYCFMWLAYGSRRPVKKPLDAHHYVTSYYPEGTEKYAVLDCRKLTDWIDRNCELLTLNECYNLLPEWFASEIERDKIRKAKRAELPLLADCRPENKTVFERRMKLAR